MKFLIFLLLSVPSAFASRPAIPHQPPSPCYGGCNDKMRTILENFNKAYIPKLTPAAYSGECFHLSRDYSPDHTHYAVTLIDQNDLNQNKPYLSTIFSFFAEQDEAADWDLERTRHEMSDEWKKSDREITVDDGTARTVIWTEDFPSYVYWLRQNPETGTLYMITYWDGTYIKSFCELRKH